MHDLHVVVRAERRDPARGLVEHAPGREDVAAAIDDAGDLLRGHVGELAFDLPRGGVLVQLTERLRDAEVGDFDVAVGRDEDVVWRKIAVHDLERSPVLAAELVGRFEWGVIGRDPWVAPAAMV